METGSEKNDSGKGGDASPFEDDHYLVERLIAKDNAAWTFVIGDRILPAIKHKGEWHDMLYRRRISLEAVATEVFISFAAGDCKKLRDFRFDSAFSTYLYNQIKWAVTTVVRMHGKEIPRDLSDYEGELALTKRKQPSPGRQVAAREAMEEFNAHLAAVWDANPAQTLVLLMRNAE